MESLPIYIKRQLDLLKILPKKSYFLFGPRQTEKTAVEVKGKANVTKKDFK